MCTMCHPERREGSMTLNVIPAQAGIQPPVSFFRKEESREFFFVIASEAWQSHCLLESSSHFEKGRVREGFYPHPPFPLPAGKGEIKKEGLRPP